MRGQSLVVPSGTTIDSPTFTGTFGTGGVFYVGSYTPTLTNTTNVAASTAFVTYYERIQDRVKVWGAVNIDPTNASSSTVLSLSLPIASNLASATDLAGTAVCGSVAGYSASLSPDTTNHIALLSFVTATDVANRTWSFEFSYRII